MGTIDEGVRTLAVSVSRSAPPAAVNSPRDTKHATVSAVPVDSLVDIESLHASFPDIPEATKHDEGKLRYDLVPPESLEAIVKVLTFGAKKYGDRNWEKGLEPGRVFAACMRHLWVWWRGEKIDAESGLSHLSHAGCCIMFLLAYEEREK